MPTNYDVARPAKRYPGPIDPALVHMATSYQTPQSNQTSARHTTADMTSQSLPQSSSLSDAADFTSPLSKGYLGVGSAPRTESILSSGSDSGQLPDRSVQRARSRDHILSTSFTPGSPRHSPSPVPPPSRTLHTSRSFSVVSPHKSSASTPGPSGHLDLKRLMSKPAMQMSSSSASLMSDSERSAGEPSSSRVGATRRPSDSAISRPPLSRSAHASREKMPLHVNTRGLRSSSVPPDEGRTSSSERREPARESHPGKASRNVLRRRPSARSNPSTPTAHHFRPAPGDNLNLVPPVRTTSINRQERLHLDSAASLPVCITHPSTAASLFAARPTISTRPRLLKSPNSPPGLTPASAVALAYKQQEQRREELAEAFDDTYRSSSATPLKPTSSRNLGPNDLDDDEGTGRPYYTVFGGVSGRLVAVGGPEDDDLDHAGYEPRATVTLNEKQHSGRSLSRKVSGSLKRVAGSMKRNEREHREVRSPSREEWKPYDGSQPMTTRDPSVHEQSHPHSKNTRKATPIDTAIDGRNSPRGSPTAKFSPSSKNSPSPREGSRPSQPSKLRHEEEMSPGSKWWKLVKRISTGGLREKYSSSAMPPPVPALPPDLKAMTPSPSRMTMDISTRGPNGEEVSENGVLLRKFMQSRSSLSGVRPSLSPPPPSTGSSRRSTSNTNTNTMKSRASTGQRPSTTRSSSPGSSDVAMSSLFNHYRTPSTRSSFSSFGEEIPPLPKPVGQHIVPPSELSRMTRSSDSDHPPLSPSQHKPRPRTQSRTRSHTAPPSASPEDRKFSLPLPPRRNTTGAASSPMASSFNVEETVNKLMPPHTSVPPPLGEFGQKEPPPRPKRSSRRAAPPNVSVPARSQSMSTARPTSPQTPRGPPQVRVDVNVGLARRPSIGALSYASTARQSSATASNSPASALASPSSAVSQARSPLTFRELESPRPRLTEKEKADKWEDLLERSARAGGTLHIGEARLMSEDVDVDGDDSFFDDEEESDG